MYQNCCCTLYFSRCIFTAKVPLEHSMFWNSWYFLKLISASLQFFVFLATSEQKICMTLFAKVIELSYLYLCRHPLGLLLILSCLCFVHRCFEPVLRTRSEFFLEPKPLWSIKSTFKVYEPIAANRRNRNFLTKVRHLMFLAACCTRSREVEAPWRGSSRGRTWEASRCWARRRRGCRGPPSTWRRPPEVRLK